MVNENEGDYTLDYISFDKLLEKKQLVSKPIIRYPNAEKIGAKKESEA